MNILEFFIGVGLAITLIAFFSFKAQSNLLEAVESSHVAHSASLVHIRNYIHLLDSEDHAQISKILTQIEKLTVALKYDIKTERLSFQVSDTGIGIPTARLESIFNPFEQAEVRTMHDFGGTGLGLSIVKKLCLAMGGNVTVTSELGIGSCFTATVIAPVGMRSNIQKAPQLQESFEGETVLIVEDNRVNQLVAKRMCQKLGFTVCIASNGEEALKKVQKAPFNVVLMDHQMPKMGGIEATCIIRNEHDFKGTILGCTADVTDETAAGYMRAGANGVITKPIRLESLAEAITQSRESKSSYVIES
ncbi:TPA: response regulator [Vibrio diabolicus]